MNPMPDNTARAFAIDARHLLAMSNDNDTPQTVEAFLHRVIDALPDPGTLTFREQAQAALRLAPAQPEARAAAYTEAMVALARRADEAVTEAARTINALNADFATQRDRLAEAGKTNTRHIALLSGYRSLIDTDDMPGTPADAHLEHLFIARVEGALTVVQRSHPSDAAHPWRSIDRGWHRDDEVELLALIDPRAGDEDLEDYR